MTQDKQDATLAIARLWHHIGRVEDTAAKTALTEHLESLIDSLGRIDWDWASRWKNTGASGQQTLRDLLTKHTV